MEFWFVALVVTVFFVIRRVIKAGSQAGAGGPRRTRPAPPPRPARRPPPPLPTPRSAFEVKPAPPLPLPPVATPPRVVEAAPAPKASQPQNRPAPKTPARPQKPQPAVESKHEPAGAAGGDLDEVLFDLWGPDRGILDASARFEEAHAGRTVRWRGTVERRERFNRDMDFGEGPATKAILALPPVKGIAVRAIVRLPEAAFDGLRVGATVTVEGRLSRCDGIGKRLLVEDGELVQTKKGIGR